MSKLKVTPRMTAVYPKLREPDDFEGQREYNIKLRCQPTDPGVQELIDELERIRDEYWETEEAQKKVKPAKRKDMRPHPVYEEEYDEDGNPTGTILFKAACVEGFKSKRTNQWIDLAPKIVDAKKNPIRADVGGGSIVKVAFQPYPWVMPATDKYGCKMRLKAVQVIELVEYGDATSVFDEEEGFEADEEPVEPDDGFTEEAPDEDDDDF